LGFSVRKGKKTWLFFWLLYGYFARIFWETPRGAGRRGKVRGEIAKD
jgi:hypothetical protein